ncbi:orotidine-5'-phosphate decarboxylase [Bacillus sp. FJAT-45037]|uniref:orotidine-5'-phosphate decarboxylase n=1 Tax=Bacillus sp. FJAT-45037 TaxID=2011007 RepID=UPI000C250B29|nr:orotidine-5'-phosphate decarboxylase [Bacillus sp. FJAT-45037]
MQRPLIIALDLADRAKRKTFLAPFKEHPAYVKVGMELFYQEGPAIIEELKGDGHRIFLDLKLHDIPNTVNRAMRVLARLEIDLVNVHAAGGGKMMEAAREGLEAGTLSGMTRPKLLAVTQLTSTDQMMVTEELLINRPLEEVVAIYAKNAQRSGLDGVVCSALEVPLLHETCGSDFLTVTPGIRQLHDDRSDQHRVVTPQKARQLGSWGIVVGRSITQAEDPFLTYVTMKKEWEGQS